MVVCHTSHLILSELLINVADLIFLKELLLIISKCNFVKYI